MSWADLFRGGSAFKRTIKQYCGQHGWQISKLEDEFASLVFGMRSGRDQMCLISLHGWTLEFVVPSFLKYDDPDDMPHRLSTLLLQRSRERKIGFWCIFEAGGNYYYSAMHNAELRLMDAEEFGRIVEALVSECDEFEGIVARLR